MLCYAMLCYAMLGYATDRRYYVSYTLCYIALIIAAADGFISFSLIECSSVVIASQVTSIKRTCGLI
jgi:hypothetical protein